MKLSRHGQQYWQQLKKTVGLGKLRAGGLIRGTGGRGERVAEEDRVSFRVYSGVE